MEDNKNTSFYLGDCKIEGRCEDEDEFENCVLEEQQMPDFLYDLDPFWQDVLVECLKYGKLALVDYARTVITFTSNVNTLADCTGASHFSHPMWHESVTLANKKGWNWSGDTDVWVFHVTACSSPRTTGF